MAHIISHFHSATLQRLVKILVFIPSIGAEEYVNRTGHPDYDHEGAKYQTLYLLHGCYGGAEDWSVNSAIERYAQKNCVTVVMPAGENSSYIDMAYGDQFLKYIAEELPDFLSRIFPLSQRREDNFIAGLGMGGYGAFRAALEYPEKYAAAVSMSGALSITDIENMGSLMRRIPENYLKYVFGDAQRVAAGSKDDLCALLKQKTEGEISLPKLFHTCGSEDFLYGNGETFVNYAKKLGNDIVYVKQPGGHDWEFWDKAILQAMDWLPLKHDIVQVSESY